MKRFHSMARAALAVMALTALAVPALAGDCRPWKLVGAGETTGVGEDGTVFVEHSGVSTQLGRYSFVGGHQFTPDFSSSAGSGITTAANGDELWVIYEADIFPIGPDDPIPYVGTVTVVGGTGRFANATGGGVLTGLIFGTPFDATFIVLVNGKICR
jgi:hypothetical protein